jgi:hypothetical protein
MSEIKYEPLNYLGGLLSSRENLDNDLAALNEDEHRINSHTLSPLVIKKHKINEVDGSVKSISVWPNTEKARSDHGFSDAGFSNPALNFRSQANTPMENDL